MNGTKVKDRALLYANQLHFSWPSIKLSFHAFHRHHKFSPYALLGIRTHDRYSQTVRFLNDNYNSHAEAWRVADSQSIWPHNQPATQRQPTKTEPVIEDREIAWRWFNAIPPYASRGAVNVTALTLCKGGCTRRELHGTSSFWLLRG